MLSDLFKYELSLIKDNDIREITRITLDVSPKCIEYIPASSSGKYHPSADLGEGGLVRHIKTTVAIGKAMIECGMLEKMIYDGFISEFGNNIKDVISNNYNKFIDSYSDVIYSALILHDCCKAYDDDEKHTTIFEHPYLASKLFKQKSEEYIKNNNINNLNNDIEIISLAIQKHMGKWNTSKYSEVELPIPDDFISQFVHTCDYLASRKYIDFNFKKYEETI